MHAEQIVGFVESNRFANLACPLLAFQATAHEHSSPAVGAGVSENAESLIALGRMLSTLEKAEPGVELQFGHSRVGKRGCVELELEEFATGTALGMQNSQAKWYWQSIPIDIDSDGRHLSARFLCNECERVY
jgi:hypothetical protein